MSRGALAIAFGPMPLGDAMLLRAGLRVAGIAWHTAPGDACDVFLAIHPGDLPASRSGGPRYVVAGPRRPTAVPATFLDRWPHIGQIADVMALLKTPAPGQQTAANTDNALDHWRGEVARAETGNRMIRVATAAGPIALLDPAHRCAWLAPSVVGRLVEALGEAPVTLSSGAREQPSPTAVRASMAHVLWALAFVGRWQPEALGIPPGRRLKLRRWPDFGSLERRDTFLHVASRLTREPASLQTLLALYAKDRDDVLVFLAGCRLCGWLEVTEEIDDTAPPAAPALPGRMQAAVGALRRALGMRGAAR